MKKVVFSANAPAAIGPYSQAIQTDKTIYVSGQLPVVPATGAFPSDDIKDQTRQSLENIKTILESAGYSMADIVKTTVLLADMNEVYGTFFTSDFPARAAFQVVAVPKGAKLEIEAVAYKA
ncbi:MAG: Rid family detoxifying hydrolase [Oscillospiraceae bacterium]